MTSNTLLSVSLSLSYFLFFVSFLPLLVLLAFILSDVSLGVFLCIVFLSFIHLHDSGCSDVFLFISLFL